MPGLLILLRARAQGPTFESVESNTIQHSHKPGSIDDKSTLDAISREGSTVGAYQASFGQGYFCVYESGGVDKTGGPFS